MATVTGNVLRINCIWDNVVSGMVANTFHAAISGSGGPYSPFDIGNFVEEWLNVLYGDSDLVDVMADDNLHSRVELFNVTQGFPIPPLPRLSGLDGTDGGQQLPTGVAALVIARTSVSRRVGRKFLPPFTEANWDGSAWSAAAKLRMDAFGTSWAAETPVGGGDETLEGIVGSGDPFVGSNIVQTQAMPVAAYQRRRKRGRGA